MTLIHKKLRNFALTLLLLVGCLPTLLVSACSCFQQNVSEALESAMNVFSGNVTNIIPGVCLGDNTITTFAIDTIWKRGNNTNITMLAINDDNNDVLLYNVSSSATEGICGGLCGYDFQLNTKYIVFTWRDSVSLCTLTTVFSDSMALELDSLSPPEQPITNSTKTTQEPNNSTITTTNSTFSLQSTPEPELACPSPSGYGICIHACNDDTSCPDEQMCCSNGCGMVCMDPVTVDSQTDSERSAPEENSDWTLNSDSTPLPTTAEPTNPEASPETTTTTAALSSSQTNDDDDRRIKIWVTVVISFMVFFIIVGFVPAIVVISRRRRNRTKISTINTSGTLETTNTDDGLDIPNSKQPENDDDPENPSIAYDSSTTTNNKTTNEKSSSFSSSSIDNNQQLGSAVIQYPQVLQQSQNNTTTARSA